MAKNKILKFTQKSPLLIFSIIIITLVIFSKIFNSSKTLIAPTIKASRDNNNSLFIAKNKAFEVEFGDKNNHKPEVKYSTPQGSNISFALANTQISSEKIINNKDSVTFKDVGLNTDIRYTTLVNGIKEEIIIKKQVSNNIFNFNLQTNNAYPNQETNSLYTGTFRDKNGNYLFHFEKPFAIDSQGNRTDNVSFQIKKTNPENNNYQLVLNVDQKWLQSPDRVYPITIDPTIVTDTITEFSSGEFNRTKNIGTTESSPIIESYYQELSADSNTVALWHLNESIGTTIADSSGNSNTGTITGTTLTTGQLGNARTFNGSSDNIGLAASTNANVVGNISIEMWIKPTFSAAGVLIHKDGQYSIQIGTTGEFYWADSSNWSYASFGATNIGLVANKWQHLAVTKSNSVVNVYLDGVLKSTKIFGGSITSTTNIMRLGCFANASACASTYFNGSIDEVRISNIARSPEEIAQDASRRTSSTYTSSVLDLTNTSSWNNFSWTANGLATGDGETPFSTTSLVGQWNFNESTGTSAVSTGSCGTSCNGTLTNFANTSAQDVGVTSGWTYNNRRWGAGALMFDGANNYINTGNNTSLTQLGTSSVTIESWVKSISVSASDQAIFSPDDATLTPRIFYGLKIGASGGSYPNKPLVVFYNNGSLDVAASPIPIAGDGLWHHIVGLRNGSTVQLYVDGILMASTTDNSRNITNASNYAYIGAAKNGSSQITFFKGVIDSTRIYNRALTDSEIISNYNSSRLEFQTRVGNSSNSNDGTWEAWRPTTNETQIDSMDTSSSSWSWDNTATYMPKSKLNDSVIKFEGSGSLKLTTGIGQTDTNIKGLWHFDETGIGTGTTLYDSSSSNNNAIATGTTAVDGIIGKARSFNGTSQYIVKTTPTNMPSGASARTISAWIKPNAVSGFRCIVSYGTAATSQISELCLNGANLYFASWANDLSGTISLSAGNWYFVTATYDGTTAKIYVNGTLDNSGAKTLNTVIDNTFGFNIGRGQDTSAGTYDYFNGLIDEVKISSVAQSAEEIAENYRLGNGHRLTRTISSTDFSSKTKLPFYVASDKLGTFSQFTYGNSAYANYEPDANTIGLWHLDEPVGSGAYIKDSSGNNYHGTPTDSYTQITTSTATKTASSTYSSYSAANAFDGSTGTLWWSNGSVTNQWLKINFGSSPQIVSRFRLYHADTATLTGYLQGSKDDSTWTTINTFSHASAGTWYTETFTNTEPYQYYRLYFTGAGSNWVQIQEWELYSTPNNSVDGKLNKSRYFNGAEYITVGNLGSFPTQGTIDFWINPSEMANYRNPLTTKYNGSNAGIRFEENASGTFGVAVGNDSGTVDSFNYLDSGMATNTWYHVVYVWNTSTNQEYGYLNGVQVFGGSHTLWPTTIPDLRFGTGFNTDAARQWKGLIDEVRISNIARSASDIRQAYEIGSRTHNITIDFKANLNSDLITNSSDLNFVVNETTYGSSSMANHIFTGDKIIVKENYNGTEYIAQGTVTSVNSSTGAISISSWDSGSTFPSGGFTTNATVFKWQREYFDITKPLSSQKNSITYLTYQITNGSSGANIWLDDLKSSSGYLSNSSGSTITSSTGNRYFQYRTIFSQNEPLTPSSQLTSVTLDYIQNQVPNIPSLDLPSNSATNQILKPILKTTATDADGDYLRYKIELCTDSSMTTNCQTFDQTSSQVGWTGQNTQTSTAYTSGTQATYTLQTNLNAGTTYYWRSYAIDPAGLNTWSSSQTTPYSFTTNSVPNIPSLDSPTNGATGQSFTPILKTTGTDNNSDYLRYKIELCTNSSMTTGCQTFDQTSSQVGWTGQNTQSDTAYTSSTQATYTLQTNLNVNTTYYWRSYAIDPAGINTWSSTQTTPYSFATIDTPAAATQCLIQESPDDSQLTVNWVDNANNENGYLIQRSVNSGAWTDLQNYAANATSHVDSTITSNNTYQYRIAPYFTGPIYSTWCYTSALNLGQGDFGLEGLELNDLILN